MKLTVVVPCRNEVKYIEECIRAIYSCSLPANTEMHVFIVDGMSDDGTREVISSLFMEFATLQIVDNKEGLTPFAFNLGIYAGGKVDFVQIVGARHIVSSNYLSESLAKLMDSNETWCVGGRIENEYIDATSEIIAKAMSTSFGMGLGNFRTLKESGYTDTVTSPMYPYWVFEKIGFFDEELVRNQDDDFNFRVTEAGGKIFYDHSISLKYYVRGTFSGLWRQFFQYGYWKVFVNRKHKAITTSRQLVPPLFVLYLCTMLCTLFVGCNVFLISSIPLVIYILLNSVFSIKVSRSVSEFFQLILTYAILHISYGLGYLKGIVDFVLLKKKPSDNQKRLSR